MVPGALSLAQRFTHQVLDQNGFLAMGSVLGSLRLKIKTDSTSRRRLDLRQAAKVLTCDHAGLYLLRTRYAGTLIRQRASGATDFAGTGFLPAVFFAPALAHGGWTCGLLRPVS